LNKLASNMVNVVRKRVSRLNSSPSSEHIVKPTDGLYVTTVVVRTTNSTVMRCVERTQCGAKLAVFRKFSQSNLAQNSTTVRRQL